ncbi:MAG: phage integrase family protein [Ruminococcaceae bacterium]|nr:phage integrase family protein [Oscillospiraceae bacterium]
MKKASSFLWGIVLIAAGALFALNALNITNIDIFFEGWWTLFIIVPCAVGLFTGRQKTLPDRNIVIDGYSGWVFLNRYGLVLSPKSANDAIDSIINKYNANEKEVASLEKRDPVYLPHQTNHMLRHSYCTRMIEKCCEPNSGIDVKIVQYLMGHNDAKTTLDIYTDVHEEFVKQTMSRFAGQIYLG